MNSFLAILLLLLIFSPIIFQIIYTIRRVKEKTKLSILMIFLLTLGLAIVTTFSSTGLFLLSIRSYVNAEGPLCINGIQLFPILGLLTAFIIAPIIGLIGGLYKHLEKKTAQ